MHQFRRVAVLALVAALLLTCGSALFGGTGYNLHCTDAECGYEGRVNFGGGFFFNQFTGYCTQCQSFVYLRWPNGNGPVKEGQERPKVEPPKPLGTVWDARTGQDGTLYACPKCKGPFMAINEPDLKCCPKCHKPTAKLDALLAYD